MEELIELKQYIESRNWQAALNLVDELEEMSKKAIINNIKRFLTILLAHLIKNQLEHRLTNLWVATISNCVRQIQELNLKNKQKTYYIKSEEWSCYLELVYSQAIKEAAIEALGGIYSASKIAKQIDKQKLIEITSEIVQLTQTVKEEKLDEAIDLFLDKLN